MLRLAHNRHQLRDEDSPKPVALCRRPAPYRPPLRGGVVIGTRVPKGHAHVPMHVSRAPCNNLEFRR